MERHGMLLTQCICGAVLAHDLWHVAAGVTDGRSRCAHTLGHRQIGGVITSIVVTLIDYQWCRWMNLAEMVCAVTSGTATG
jgi:hypothetical protein